MSSFMTHWDTCGGWRFPSRQQAAGKGLVSPKGREELVEKVVVPLRKP